jgi:transposase
MIPNSNFFLYFEPDNQILVSPKTPIKSIKSIGASFIIEKVLERCGVTQILKNVFTDGPTAEMILAMVVFMASRGNIMEDNTDWCDEYWISSDPVSAPTASYLFSRIDYDRKMQFFKKWIAINQVNGYLAYDVTSFSSYAKGMNDQEMGYNRDGDKLPQINMGCYLSQLSGLPMFYVIYPGSIVDKSHMRYMMQYNDELGIKSVIFIMDRGFCSTANIQWLHSHDMPYVMAVDKHHKTTMSAIDEVRDDIQSFHSRITDSEYSKTVTSRFYGVKSSMHVYYSVQRAEEQKADMFKLAVDKGKILEQMSKLTTQEARYYSRFYDIARKNDGTFTYNLSYDKLDKEAMNCGYFCILSNTILPNNTILSIYKRKDMIEKGFDEIKNHIDMKRLQTHNDITTHGKLFCAFLALIATSIMTETLQAINKVSEKRRLSKRKLITELEKMKIVSYQDTTRMMNPITKLGRLILNTFGFTEEDVKSYGKCTNTSE